jgi:hypothetical protein
VVPLRRAFEQTAPAESSPAWNDVIAHNPVAPATSAAPEPPPPAIAASTAKSAADLAFVGTLTAIAAILASRLLLLLAVTGAFVLSLRADGYPGLAILVSYTVLTVLPLVWLDLAARRPK